MTIRRVFIKQRLRREIFFLNKVLPETGSLMSSIMSGASTYTKFDNEYFESSFS